MAEWADQNEFFIWILHYGSIALFFLLALGIVALPIPDETLLVVSGFWISQGSLSFGPTVLAAYLGSMCGITLSYLIGRSGGHYLLDRYGRWVGLSHHKLEITHQWFETHGKWVLCFGYFIPGVRHLTGIAAGTMELNYKEFSLFAYSGAILWATVFLTIGFFCGEYCWTVLQQAHAHLDAVGFIILGIVVAIWLFRRRQRKDKDPSGEGPAPKD